MWHEIVREITPLLWIFGIGISNVRMDRARLVLAPSKETTMNWLFNQKCDACNRRLPDVKGRSDWAPPGPMCDECYNRWWEANKNELG